MEKNKRNRAETTERIITALEQLLAEQGTDGINITLLAEKANVSKVLIYRYFGNLDGLLEYYIKMGRIIPHYNSGWLEQIRPTQEKDLAATWSNNALQLFRTMRASPTARELLKTAVQGDSVMANVVSSSIDSELANLVNQLSFVEGSDHDAISAVVLGGLSYLTVLAQLDRSAIGLHLRDETDWLRVEKAVKMIYTALAKMAADSPTTKFSLKPAEVKFLMQ
ncbi:TetR/AcrR family transcriptional regulator [Spirosoma aerophilum]